MNQALLPYTPFLHIPPGHYYSPLPSVAEVKEVLTNLTPLGVSRIFEYRARLQKLGLPANLALFERYRLALYHSKIEYLPEIVRHAPMCVVDVGANVGMWSLGIAQLTHAKQIIAYEPVSTAYKQLVQKTQSYPQITCIQSAIGDYVGTITINVEQNLLLSSVLEMQDTNRKPYGHAPPMQGRAEVPITTLDNELSQYSEITLLKIDVQGYDRNVLVGAQTILQKTKVLIIEVAYTSQYHNEWLFGDLHQFITSICDMQLWCILPPRFYKSKPLDTDAIYIQKNLIPG
jgi:FkbM family methyltransferase